jgi:restriction system protein
MRFPKFAEFLNKAALDGGETPGLMLDPIAVTPEEQMGSLAAAMRRNLAVELLDQVLTMDPFLFGRLFLDLLIAMGYGGSREEAAEAGKGVNDGGIDGLINEDRLGLDRIYVQAKRWQSSVGRPEIQNFVGALAGRHAHKGIFLTTSEFTAGAKEYAEHLP